MSRPEEKSTLLGMGVSNDVVNGVLSALDFFRLGIRDVDGELVLDVENELDLLERVEAKILLEVRVRSNSVGVNLVEALDDLNNTSRNLLLRKTVVLTVEAHRSRLELEILSSDHTGRLRLRSRLNEGRSLNTLGETSEHGCVDGSTFHRALAAFANSARPNSAVFLFTHLW